MKDSALNETIKNVATVVISTGSIIRIFNAKDRYSSDLDHDELREILDSLNTIISKLLNHPIWQNFKDDFDCISYDTPETPNIVSNLFSAGLHYLKEKGIIGDTIEEAFKYCEEKIIEIYARIDEVWLFDCRLPNSHYDKDYKNAKRFFYLLKIYWNLYRNILHVCGHAGLSRRPHPLARLITNLKYRIQSCIEQLGNDELTSVYSNLSWLNPIESEDFSIDWECGGVQISNEFENAIEEGALRYGSRRFKLTPQENFFITVCNEATETYEKEMKEALDKLLDRVKMQAKKFKPFDYSHELNELKKIDTNILIKNGESEQVEFKSTFQFDLKQKQINKSLRILVIKTISAFLNSKGGTLLIGIDDNGNVLGLLDDYSTLRKKRNKDGFELALCQEISNRIGDECFNYLSVRFPLSKKKEICRIDATMSAKPTFVKEEKGKNFYKIPVFL